MINPYADFMGDDMQGMFFQNAMRMLLQIEPEKLDHAISQISKATTMGPLIDPTAWMGGEKFKNSRQYTQTFKLVLPLIKHLREISDA